MAAVSVTDKEWRRKSIERKRLDRTTRRNPMARELANLRYRRRIVNTNEKQGSKNLVRDYYNKGDIIDEFD